MSPTAEQLIRDYLNRLSVAARTKLHSEDRRAFLARMRFSIERHCGPPDRADPAEVAEVLASLGDPGQLVDAEAARLKARGKKGLQAEGGSVPQTGGSDAPQTGGSPAPAGRAGRPGPQLATPQGTPQRRRRTPSPWLVSGTGLNPAGGAAGSSRTPVPLNPVLASRSPTGEIKVQSRPITSRWRPGQALQPRQPKPKQSRRLRVAWGGKASDKSKAADSQDGAIKAGDREAIAIKAGDREASEIKASEQAGEIEASNNSAGQNTVSEDLATGGSRPTERRAPDDARGLAASAESGAASQAHPATRGGPPARAGRQRCPRRRVRARRRVRSRRPSGPGGRLGPGIGADPPRDRRRISTGSRAWAPLRPAPSQSRS